VALVELDAGGVGGLAGVVVDAPPDDLVGAIAAHLAHAAVAALEEVTVVVAALDTSQ
jgi:hypothetical protein